MIFKKQKVIFSRKTIFDGDLFEQIALYSFLNDTKLQTKLFNSLNIKKKTEIKFLEEVCNAANSKSFFNRKNNYEIDKTLIKKVIEIFNKNEVKIDAIYLAGKKKHHFLQNETKLKNKQKYSLIFLIVILIFQVLSTKQIKEKKATLSSQKIILSKLDDELLIMEEKAEDAIENNSLFISILNNIYSVPILVKQLDITKNSLHLSAFISKKNIPLLIPNIKKLEEKLDIKAKILINSVNNQILSIKLEIKNENQV
jgi:hypothetical protein